MKGLIMVTAIATGLLFGREAFACDYCGDPDYVPGAASGTGPLLSDDDVALGFYVVTKAYVGDTVTVSGNLTTYGVATVDVTPNTIAVDVHLVASGQPSPFDGTSMNTRASLSDGRSVGGTYVDSYTVDETGTRTFIGRTFVQDDAEMAKDAARAGAPVAVVEPVEPPGPAPIGVATPDVPSPGEAEVGVAPFEPISPPAVGGIDGPIVEPAAPGDREVWEPGAPDPSPRVPGGPPPSAPSGHDVRAGIALAPQADVLAGIEILRGRRTALWVRASVDGSPARVLSWQLVAGEVTALGPVSGPGDDPFVAQWLTVTPPNAAFVLRISALVEVPREAPRSVLAAILVTVRSPALVE